MSEPVREIRRRAMSRQEEGFCCGMSDTITVDAEIEADYHGRPVFFHAQWRDAAGALILFEATEESLYDIWEKYTDDGVFGDLMVDYQERQSHTVEAGSDLPDGFRPQYDALQKMIRDELRKLGLSPYDYKAFR